MTSHRYKITVEKLDDPDAPTAAPPAPLQFEAGSHDDIFVVAERLRAHQAIDPQEAARMAVGIKLFGGLLLEKRTQSPFKELFPAFGDFMKQLKKGVK
ncbi:MAG: DUF3861 domain-containing protein [Aquabacterium sp.]|uniref:DUF3861 domain-containing protein n=1 Tax=Aquabacterium sp. TaxID=1872578 RepID=UPI003BDA10BC